MTTLAEPDLLKRLDQLTSAVVVLANMQGSRLTRKEMAQRLRIHTRTLAERIDNGSVPPPKDGMWLLADVIEWEAREYN